MWQAPESDASRRIVLGGKTLDYRLRRSARRSTIGLTVDQHGLSVAAPAKAKLRDIEKLLAQHARWVLDKLNAWEQRPRRQIVEIVDAAILPLFGQPFTLRFAVDCKRGHVLDRHARTLTLCGAQLPREALLNALRAEARADFLVRLARFAERIGKPTPSLRLSDARTRWGSCNHRGGISLNWRLVLMPTPLIDYVVAHEVAHLREMNHSPAFWAIVGELCPDWRRYRQELKAQALTLPEFS